MAKKPSAASTPGGPIKPDGKYEIKLKRAVKHGETWLRPGAARIRVTGAVLIELGDAVELYREV